MPKRRKFAKSGYTGWKYYFNFGQNFCPTVLFRFWLAKLKNVFLKLRFIFAVVMVGWSACLTSIPTIRVRIPLKFSSLKNCCWKDRKKEKEDRLGDFWNLFIPIFLTKVPQLFGDFSGYFEKHNFLDKNVCDYYWATFHFLGYFSFLHLVTLNRVKVVCNHKDSRIHIEREW